ncbi:MAG: glucose-6-phosphate isomerase [Gammaproteobacteria bacterium]|nr:glucose-6-phosphate isomerase [Gammaproteobacteria bacterium]
MTAPTFTSSATYQTLQQQAKILANTSLSALFTHHPQRASLFSLEGAGLLFDYSKNLLDTTTLNLLIDLADSVSLPQAIEHYFSGTKINSTEQRAALHTALRSGNKQALYVDGKNIRPSIHATLEKMGFICDQIQDGIWRGFTGKPITDVVNIGIGGADLGPKMASCALTPYHQPSLTCHFVSNMDGSDIHAALAKLCPETTLFIVSSKTFTTVETLTNAHTAKQWLLQQAHFHPSDLDKHFIAITSQPDKAIQFGISPSHILPLWDWVGGRFSVWSAVGLPLALSIGMKHFRAFLQGAQQMDEHFRTQPLRQNMPVLLGLISFWYTHFLNAKTHAILPYDHHLRYLVSYLQQLEMESNGKQKKHNGEQVAYTTCPIIWGDVGTNGQHAFHQLLHQGTHLNPLDFIVAINPHHPYTEQHQQLFAHCLAQSHAFVVGCTEEEAAHKLRQRGLAETDIKRLSPHLVMAGNRPHNIILLPKLTPAHLGALIALYEHKVFVLGTLWNINSFDQWGVELGKEFAIKLLPALQSKDASDIPASLSSVVHYYHRHKT